jgi:signal transduction histidine kinase
MRNGVEVMRQIGLGNAQLDTVRDMLERQVLQLSRLVDDLLDVSRITRGKIELRKERVELETIVKSAVEASRPLIEKSGHKLMVSIPPLPIFLEADQTRMAQVLLNLLNNSAKYTDGRPHLADRRTARR